MKIRQILSLSLLLVILLCGSVVSQGATTATAPKVTGIYFEIEISSPGKESVVWKNWRYGDKYYGESVINGNPSMIIIKDGFSYSLSPDIKVARKSKIVTDEKKNPLAGKYGVLADIPQINPVTYLTTIKNLGAQLQGTATLGQNNQVDLHSLTLPANVDFPWNNFMFWFDKTTQFPLQITYNEGTNKRTLKFGKVDKSAEFEASRFDVPKDYKEIFFEWDQ